MESCKLHYFNSFELFDHTGFLFGWTSALLQGPTAAAWISAGLLRITAFLPPSVSAPIFLSRGISSFSCRR